MAILSADGTYVTVERGDTLYAIATAHNTTVSALAKLNNIKNPDLITVGQIIKLTGTASSTTTNSNQATILQFGLLSNKDDTLYASWEWTKTDTTESYQIKWEYKNEKWADTWLVGNSSSINVDENDPTASQQCTYAIPEGALSVRFMVKPISKKKSSSDTSVHWTASWSTEKIYNTSDNPPSVPPIPDFAFKQGLEVLATLTNLDVNATTIRFQILKRDGTSLKQFAVSDTTIRYVDDIDAANRTNGYARYSCYVDPGGEYFVRARSIGNEIESDWSDYSASLFAPTYAPTGFTSVSAKTKTSVELVWNAVDGAKTYDIEYTTEREYFGGSNSTTIVSGIEGTRYILTGLETGDEYFFRIRAVNSGGESDWSWTTDKTDTAGNPDYSGLGSIILGKIPGAPTTWSSTTTVIVGEPLYLYWIHNSEDSSSQTWAELELTIGGSIEIFTIQNSEDEDEKDKTSSYVFDTSGLTYGSTILWRVRTKGVMDEGIIDGVETNGYGEWSTQREITVFAKPTISMSILDAAGDQVTDESINDGAWYLTAFPIDVSVTQYGTFEPAVGFYITIAAEKAYETTNAMGNTTWVAKGDRVFARNYFDPSNPNGINVKISAGDAMLENNIPYIISCEVTMSSGLTAVASIPFTTKWTTATYWPNAEISIDGTSYSAVIMPYCRDSSGNLVTDHTLSVYRRNYDGSLTEIATNVSNVLATHVSDPHPALDYARYRIVATSTVTGASCFYDMPGLKIGAYEFVIQWDEAWSDYDIPDEYAMVQPVWTGSMLKLPYNISVDERVQPDAEHINYIGRKHPVGYYGTHLNETSTWSTVIPKSDVETLYALRRLARWNGKVYVREPSGIGYWATVNVSLSQKYRELTIPVSLNITRIEGGV